MAPSLNVRTVSWSHDFCRNVHGMNISNWQNIFPPQFLQCFHHVYHSPLCSLSISISWSLPFFLSLSFLIPPFLFRFLCHSHYLSIFLSQDFIALSGCSFSFLLSFFHFPLVTNNHWISMHSTTFGISLSLSLSLLSLSLSLYLPILFILKCTL